MDDRLTAAEASSAVESKFNITLLVGDRGNGNNNIILL